MKLALTILTLLLAFLWQSCIHTYPDDNAEDPTTVEIAVDLTLNLKWSQLLSFYPQTKSADVAHRFIIEISTQGMTPFRHEQIIDPWHSMLTHSLPFPLSTLMKNRR